MNNSKSLFIDEVNKIKSDDLRECALELVEEIPAYFWTVPASSSGKYHPECDLGEGGLVRHSIMVATVAEDLVRAEMFVRECPVNYDIARFTALFHDSYKSGLVAEDGTYSDHTVFDHPRIASDIIREKLTAKNIDPLKIEMICGAIYTHMGKWCVDTYGERNGNAKKALSKPRTDFEKLIHIADYMASRKYIAGLEAWKGMKNGMLPLEF